MRSITIFGIGLSFALAGVGLFLMTLRKPAAETAEAARKTKFRAGRVPVKRTDERLEAEQQIEKKKLRIAAAALLALGAAVMVIS